MSEDLRVLVSEDLRVLVSEDLRVLVFVLVSVAQR